MQVVCAHLGVQPCSSSSISSKTLQSTKQKATHIQALAVLAVRATNSLSSRRWKSKRQFSNWHLSILFSPNLRAFTTLCQSHVALLPTYFAPVKPVSPLSVSQTHQQLYQLTTVARAQARTTMTWTYLAPWCPTPSPDPRQRRSFLR